jgi:hypothetical protein
LAFVLVGDFFSEVCVFVGDSLEMEVVEFWSGIEKKPSMFI